MDYTLWGRANYTSDIPKKSFGSQQNEKRSEEKKLRCLAIFLSCFFTN
jgi:hypothetical protein